MHYTLNEMPSTIFRIAKMHDKRKNLTFYVYLSFYENKRILAKIRNFMKAQTQNLGFNGHTQGVRNKA